MKIKKCYIENFGKLHEFKYEFSDGLNIINEMNGWGKSTLATFIKVMFYGFDSSNKKAISENERKKYYPWQGGKFGGNLEFEIDGNIYEIERFFGLKEKEDTFKLYNKQTNMESNDYSSNIGEEIFKIDRSAYERSTYIPQQSIDIKINDSLSAKLSNILESENDINTSDKAIEKIKNEMREYKKTGKKGLIYEIENKILNEKRKLEKANKNEELINERNKKINEIKLKIKELENEKEINQKKFNELNENERNILIKNRYIEICNIINQDEEEIKNINNYFKNSVPTESDIKKYEKNISDLDIYYSKLDDLIIDDETINNYEKLKKYFYEKNINEEKLNDNFLIYSKIENLNSEINLLNEKLISEEKIEKIKNKNKKTKNNLIIIFSIVIILIGIILGLKISKYLFLIILIGILLLIFQIINKNKKIEKNTEKILKLITEKKQEISGLENKLNLFFNNFENLIGNNYEKLNKIKNDLINYKNNQKIISEKENKRKEYEKNIEKIIEENFDDLKTYFNEEINKNNYVEFNNKCKNIIFEINNKKRDLNNLLIKYENDKKIREKYEKENNIQNIKIINIHDEENNINNLKNKNEKLINEINNLINQKSYDENELNRLINTLETTEEIEVEIENLENKLLEINKKYDTLEKTQEYLIKAKEKFSSHYLKNMTEGFEKYLNIIDGSNLDTNLDTKLNVKIKSNGENKEIDYFSTGYKDLIGICIRFALIDALFENEKPFIILDDPFVNLDEDKIEKARKIIEELSKKYQVIYFICHKSRE